MASLIPSFEKILSLKVKPEEGELHLLKFLDSHLDESFEFNFIHLLMGIDQMFGVIFQTNTPKYGNKLLTCGIIKSYFESYNGKERD
jgi:hypothetical protein